MSIYDRQPYYGHSYSIAMINDSRSILDKDKRFLESDVLPMKSLQLFILSSKEEHRVYLESLLSKHTTYLLKIYEQIVQYGRFKKTSVALKRVLKNVTEWSDNNPNFILTIYKLINQGVKTFSDQYYNTHQISILLNTVTDNIYDNCNYTSCVN